MQTVNQNKIYLSLPHLTGDELEFIVEALESNWVSTVGPNINEFEREVANLVRVPDAVALSSGTAAIHLALVLLGVGRGDEVFCSTFTFVASSNPILYQGAIPVFIDSEEETWCMSPQALKEAFAARAKIGKLPKAVIVADIYGQIAKMDEIQEICTEYEVPIVEDAAEALGSIYQGKAAGTFGEFGILSFNGNKIITTSGGGMLLCKSKEMGRKARFLASQAKDDAPYYEHSQLGFNYRMSNLLAGVGRTQLRHLEQKIELRRAIFQRYYENLRNLPGIQFMPEGKDSRSNRWLSVIIVDEKLAGVSSWEILEHLKNRQIEARAVWKPMHRQPLYKDCAYFSHDEGVSYSDYLFQRGLCLPSGSNLTMAEQNLIIESIRQLVVKST